MTNIQRELRFEVLGPPQPKERARRGRGGHWFTPERTRRYEAAVKTVARFSTAPSWPLKARYALTVTAYFPDARRRDGDNVLKAVADACNGVLWADDSQIVDKHVHSRIDRDNPRTLVQVVVVETPAEASPRKPRAKKARPA